MGQAHSHKLILQVKRQVNAAIAQHHRAHKWPGWAIEPANLRSHNPLSHLPPTPARSRLYDLNLLSVHTGKTVFLPEILPKVKSTRIGRWLGTVERTRYFNDLSGIQPGCLQEWCGEIQISGWWFFIDVLHLARDRIDLLHIQPNLGLLAPGLLRHAIDFTDHDPFLLGR